MVQSNDLPSVESASGASYRDYTPVDSRDRSSLLHSGLTPPSLTCRELYIGLLLYWSRGPMTADAHIMTGLSRIGMLLRSEGWRQAEATGLTPTQAQILAHLDIGRAHV